MLRRLLVLWALLLPLSAAAQFGFEYRPQAAVVRTAADTLRLGWAGGLNSPQYSQLDLNGDQLPDLLVFERTAERVLTFLNAPAPGGGRRWQYAPAYESLFPNDLVSWVLLRDYDCDGRPDLWTQSGPGDVRVFRNVAGPGGRPSFQLAQDPVNFYNTPQFNGSVYLNAYDVPAVQDVNGDGQLDIVAFDFASNTIAYYRNVSTSCGGLSFRLETQQWAGLSYCANSCTNYVPGGAACRVATPNRVNHTGGYSLLLQDFDNDGDQDALLGRDECAPLTGVRNTGTAATAATNAGSILASLPNGLGAVSLVNYPAAFAVDATFDGRPDLVVASALVDNADLVSLRNAGTWFENTGTASAPAYVRRTGSFLQSEMLDVSEGAASAFADLDGDGLVDMLVANTADQYGAPLSSATYRASLAHYRNVGSASRPVFSLVTDDYLGLAARNFRNLRPAFTDLDRDGAVDLVFGAATPSTTSLYYCLNTAQPGQPAAFNPAQLGTLNNVANFAGDSPCFADVDGDGYLDLLLGTYAVAPAGPLRYYRRNPALPLASAFALVDDDFGRIRTATGGLPLNLAPAVADADGDGRPDLLILDQTGRLQLFANYRAQTGTFVGRTDLVYNGLTNQYEESRWGKNSRARNHLSLADLNADNVPELVVGLDAGGLLLYGARSGVTSARSRAAEALPLQVYPNPAAQLVTVETPAATQILLRDLLGRVVRQGAGPAQRRQQLNVQGLVPGVYLLEATDATGRRGVQRLEVMR